MLCTNIVVYFCPFCDGRYERGTALHPIMGRVPYLLHQGIPCLVYLAGDDALNFISRFKQPERQDLEATQELSERTKAR